MRLALLAVLLTGCGLGFDAQDNGPDEPTAEECIAAGGKIVQRTDGAFCDLPASGGYVAAKLAQAKAGDAGAHD
jgi:hypothetical protein